ncbi:hypothetical protein [Rathayibacter sp. AY1E4]|uniref:hypothetical protein n=1 Tax=Rathayibacter sp. AY1E4 TaxID=2080552 RepID=UPI0011B0F034|nr:hypothetical protein [Rathayibacter sp. AY1E4]
MATALKPWFATTTSGAGIPEWIQYIILAVFAAVLIEVLHTFVFTRPGIEVEWKTMARNQVQSNIHVRVTRRNGKTDKLVSTVRLSRLTLLGRLLVTAITRSSLKPLVLEVSIPQAPVRCTVDDSTRGGELEHALGVANNRRGISFELLTPPDETDVAWCDAELAFATTGSLHDAKYQMRYRFRRGDKPAKFASLILTVDAKVRELKITGGP